MTNRKKWTPEDFKVWQEKHAPRIESGQEQRRREIEHAVIEYIRKAMRDWHMTLNAAGDDLLRRFPFIGASTPPETKAALIAIGWAPPRQRGKGGAA